MVISIKKFFSPHQFFEKVLPPRFTCLRTDPILPHPELPLVRDGVYSFEPFMQKRQDLILILPFFFKQKIYHWPANN
jgi:hypothetical protein